MEFENVNNMNIALEASMKKKTFQISKLVHRLKKFLRRAKPQCPLSKPCYTMNCEEEDAENRKNEEMERRMKNKDTASPDMRTFFYTTEYQRAQSQVY